MELYKGLDPNNIGLALSVYLDGKAQAVLVVRSLSRETQIEEHFRKMQGGKKNPNFRLTSALKNQIIEELHRAHILAKPSIFGLAGSGKIAWWEGNPHLAEEYNQWLGLQRDCRKLSSCAASCDCPWVRMRPEPTAQERKNKEVSMALRVLQDKILLLKAAEATANSEFVQETGLMEGNKILLALNAEGKNREVSSLSYPRFSFLIEEIVGGKLRTKPIKTSISVPEWLKVSDLDLLNFYPSHLRALRLAFEHCIKEGETAWKASLQHINELFRQDVERRRKPESRRHTHKTLSDDKPVTAGEFDENVSGEETWASFTKSVKPLRRQ